MRSIAAPLPVSQPTKHLLYIVLKPGEVNGNLAAHEGRLLVIVPNYTEVFEQPPAITDGISQAFQVEVQDDEVQIQQEGTRSKILLWKGDQHSRSRSADKLTLPILSLIPLGLSAVATKSPEEIAQLALGALPPEVQLAALVVGVSHQVLAAAGLSAEQGHAIRTWAQQRVARWSAEQA
jgi:hypothetical protein